MELEVELVKFETWAEQVRPFLTDPEYLKTALYDELRLAIRILGIRVTVFPTQGEWEYRYKIAITVPEVRKKLDCFSMNPYPENPTAWQNGWKNHCPIGPSPVQSRGSHALPVERR